MKSYIGIGKGKVELAVDEAVRGCDCVCPSGRNVSYAAAWLPVVPNCQCSCGGGTTNKNGNYQLAYNAAH